MGMSGKLIFALDVGSSKIVSLVGSLGERVAILGISSYYFVNSKRNNDFTMMSNGLICDIERTGQKIAQTLHEAQINADCSTGSLITNISGNHLRSLNSQSLQEMGSLPVNAEIIRLLVEDAKRVDIPNSYDIIDYEVQEYLVDGEHLTLNPLELSCKTVESNVNLFLSGKIPLANLKKSIRYSSFEVAKIVPAPILSALAVLNDDEKELGCCLIDIGAGTTDVVVYQAGFVRYMVTIAVGGEDITRDIASVLKVARNLAEDLKLTHGSCNYHAVKSTNEGINLIDHRGESVLISRKLLNDVISERMKDILQIVKTQLDNNQLYDIIDSGLVITGGGALLTNLKEFASKFFDIKVSIGVPRYEGEFADIVCNPKFSTAIGALYFANEFMLYNKYADEFKFVAEHNSTLSKIKNFFKNM